jgi:hypothetical protein
MNAVGPERLLDGVRDLPWVDVAAGVRSKTLALFRGGWVSLLELESGARIPLHRHLGAVHGYVLAGRRHLGESGRVAGPGSYDYEPPGHVDTWWAEGTGRLLGLFIVHGGVEYLAPNGDVAFRETAATKESAYLHACRAAGFEPRDLRLENNEPPRGRVPHARRSDR